MYPRTVEGNDTVMYKSALDMPWRKEIRRNTWKKEWELKDLYQEGKPLLTFSDDEQRGGKVSKANHPIDWTLN